MGNGNHFQCNSSCFDILICLGATKFLVDLYILPIDGWKWYSVSSSWRLLGSILMDYGNLTMHSNWLGNTIHLQRLHENDIKEISLSQLKAMQDTKAISVFYHLEHTSSTQNSLPNFTTVPAVLIPFVHFLVIFFGNLKACISSGAFTQDSIESTFPQSMFGHVTPHLKRMKWKIIIGDAVH